MTDEYCLMDKFDFNICLTKLFPNRMLPPDFFNKCYSFFENHGMEEDAFLMLVKYIVNEKGEDIHINYILKVASNLDNKGIITTKNVESYFIRIEQRKKNTQTIIKAKPTKLDTCVALFRHLNDVDQSRVLGYMKEILDSYDSELSKAKN